MGNGPTFSIWAGLRELPVLDEARRSNVPGVYVAGDLADAPILKAALLQGRQTGERVAADLKKGARAGQTDVDVVIVGAGPAGVQAAIALHEKRVPYVVLERDRPFRTLDAFPKGKVLYADPREVPVPDGVDFPDAPKERIVRAWTADVQRRGLRVETNQEVTAIEGQDGAFVVKTSQGAWRCRKVILAIGRRGTPRRLGVPGEDADHVLYELDDPARYAGKPVVVVGGGDSAIEAAVALSEAGADVTLAHRGSRFDRPKRKNRARLEKSAVRAKLGATIGRIGPKGVQLGDGSTIKADAVFVLIGAELPLPLLRKLGITLVSDRARELARIPFLLAFAALIWCFYVLKQHRELLPFSGALGWVHEALRVPVPWLPTADGSVRTLDAGFWGTLIYTLTIAFFAVLAVRRWNSPEQRKRYASLVAFQAVVLFGVPEILAPIVTSAPAKLYAIGVPWPLSIWSLAHEPAAWGWLLIGALVSFVAIPLYVRRNNERFCSWMCGCGGLAETLGDLWRWRAPRGDGAKRAEGAGLVVLACAIPVTLLVLNDLWGLVGFHTWLDQEVRVEDGRAVVADAPAVEQEGYMRISEAWTDGDRLHLRVQKYDWDGAWHDNGWIREIAAGDALVYPEQVEEGHYALPLAQATGPIEVRASSSSLSRATDFARSWYSLVVDFALASVIGVALYPLLGNRVWCRFFCPLRAYMQLISARIGRLAIAANDKCISCGECTRYCQMGIDVQGFAEQGLHFDNANSACIQCGICVDVCPMDTLSLVDKREAGLPDGTPGVAGPRWGV
jgi:NosR/NirI family nitrous oxide reductase transcriptional regulator